MTVEPFRNEPIERFTTEESKKAMKQALAEVRAQFGKEYPLVIAGERVFTGDFIDSLDPSDPARVVGRVARA